MNVTTLSTRSLAILALGTTLAAGASAQTTYFKRSLPDYDQRRTGLPGDGGMYCVPTAYVNLFKFMSWYGLPNMDSAYGNGYSDVTAFIKQMGVNMGTTASGGTGGNAAYNAATAWASSHDGMPFMVNYRYGPNTYWGPSKVRNLVNTGAMIDICYGRYRHIGSTWTREGGHSVALSGYDWRYATKKLLVADPASDDGSIYTQGAYTIDEKSTATTSFVNSDGNVRVLPRYDLGWSGANGDRQAAVDYMHGMMPLWGGGFSGVNKSGYSVFTANFPFQLNDGANDPVKQLIAEVAGDVIDWGMDHGDMAVVALTRDGVVHHLDLVSKVDTRLGSFPGAKKLVVAGAGLDVFVLVDGGRTDGLLKLDRKTGKKSSLEVPKGITSLEADPVTRGIIAINPAQKAIIAVDEDLRGVRVRPVSLPDGTGELFAAASADGSVSLARTGAKQLIRLGADGSIRPFQLPTVRNFREFRAIGNGFFMAQDGDQLITLDAEGRPAKSQFEGMRSADRFRFAQSWSAMKPQDIEGKGWENVLPLRGQP